jgi:uncharacterized membrane protein YedE/YeeE
MRVALNGIAGLLFGLGLIVSGMVNPAKVLNFLDPFGTFDPSLAFVMAGAVAVTFVGYRLVLRRPRPILADRFRLPLAKDIDIRLVLGPAIFGIGWGLSGFCPGPAITSLPLLAKGTLVFVPGMLAGMALSRLFMRTGLQAKKTMPAGNAQQSHVSR